MSWMTQLYLSYENRAGKNLDSEVQLTPIAHMDANVQLEVSLNRMGEFVAVRILEKKEGVTLIPVTESSAGRASGIAPHALSDTLSYIAGDFADYCDNAKQSKIAREKFENYINNLKKWTESEDSHSSIRVIYRYLLKKTLIADLVKAGVVQVKENHTLEDGKIGGQPYEKVMVRFRIINAEQGKDAVWRERTLVEAYTRYYLKNQQGREDICYLIGEKRTVSKNHPKGIIAANYGAKLVSANDSQGYTYRGRFQNAGESVALSYEASQKIHSALTFLVKTQGVSVGKKDKRTFLCWNPGGKKLPDIFSELELYDEDEAEWTEVSYRKKLRRVFQGYREKFEEIDSVVMMGLDAATTGRLSLTYYQELLASDFLERYMEWQETCEWYFLRFNEKKKPDYRVETPIFKRIVECAFGRERNGLITVEDKVLKEHVQRLVKCMVEKERLPFDIVQALTVRASTPLAYSRINRECVLSTACAMISKYNLERKGEQKKMELNDNNSDRSYLFGRLLAVYEKVERSTYERGETRDPNAVRLQSVYVNHPMQTLKILEQMVEPYFRKLSPGLREYYKSMISKIIGTFKDEDAVKMNQGLEADYLLGYYLQRAELNKKKDGGEKNEQSDEQN